jgi:indole-3-glycerol phosphate synthase
VLLIAALLDPSRLRELISIIQRNRMTEIIQVQSEEEILEAIEFEPRVIAISNRDMHTYQLDLDTTLRLRHLIPPRMAVISMGGLRTAHDVAYVSQANIDGVIVGQALLTAQNTAQAIQDLFGQDNP